MSDHIHECVLERRRESDVLPTAEVWHAARGQGDADFQPIMCGIQDGSGINLPGGLVLREPTCPSCIKALKDGEYE